MSPCADARAVPFEASAVQSMAMPHQTSSSRIEMDRIEALSRELQRWLTDVRASLAGEIRSYPTPIPRCDAQFNHLFEQRGRLSRLLTDLETAVDRRDNGAALRAILPQLADLLPQGDSTEERSLRDRIDAELAGHR
jgi:hypothetical protein